MGSRKKRQEKKKDFLKTKLRVGKTTDKPSNFTDTSFKAKSIHLRQQIQINLNKDEEFKKQLSLLKHHSPASRKEVVVQITNQIKALPSNTQFAYDELLTKLKPMILDQSRQVREAVVELLKLITEKKPSIIVLHQGSLVLFILSAMTHIEQAIRNDSLKFLNILLESNSEELIDSIIRANWAKILRNFMQLLDWTIDGNKLGSTSVSFSVTTSNASLSNSKNVKKLKERKLTQLQTLTKVISFGCPFEKPEQNEENEVQEQIHYVQVHPLTFTYMVPKKTNPFDSLKLFNSTININLNNSKDNNSKTNKTALINVEGLPSEDVSNRSKILIEIFNDGLVKGLTDLQNDDSSELRKIAERLLVGLATIKEDYEADLQT